VCRQDEWPGMGKGGERGGWGGVGRVGLGGAAECGSRACVAAIRQMPGGRCGPPVRCNVVSCALGSLCLPGWGNGWPPDRQWTQAMMRNHKNVEFVHTIMAIFTGAAAGILGFTGLYGFLLFLSVHAAVSGAWWLRCVPAGRCVCGVCVGCVGCVLGVCGVC
jgi:hypothetical protein